MSGNHSEHNQWLNRHVFSAAGSFNMIIWSVLILLTFIVTFNILSSVRYPAITNVAENWEIMNLTAITNFALLIVGLIILQLKLTGAFFTIITKISAVIICVLSILTIFSFVYLNTSGKEFLISTGLFYHIFFSPEHRMAILTAVGFLLLGIILLLLLKKSKKASDFAHILVFPVYLICYFTIVSYILGVYNATALSNNAVAIFTGISFYLICFVIFLMRPYTWFMKLYTINDSGGLIARLLTIPVILLPIIIGAIRFYWERGRVISSDEATVIETVIYTLALSIVTFLTTYFVRKIEKKKNIADQALRESEKRLIASNEMYEELLANARSIIIKQKVDGRITYVNDFGLKYFGFEKEEMLGKYATETIVPPVESTGRDLFEMIKDIYDDPDKHSLNINENIRKNGERVWVEWHNQAIFDKNNVKTGHIAIGIDITERRKSEEALRQSEEKLWSVLNVTQESIYMFDLNGFIIMTNSTGVKRLKKTSYKDVIGHHFSEFMPPAVAKLRLLKMNEVMRTGNPLKFEDERDGRVFSHNFFPIFADGKVKSLVTYSRDITKSKKAEFDLRESEDRFRTIAESLPVMISIFGLKDSSLLFVNESTEKNFGYNKSDLVKQSYDKFFIHPEMIAPLGKELALKGRILNTEIQARKSDGTPFWIMTSVRTITYMHQPAYLTASIDITETKKVQDELIRLNRALNARSKSSKAMMDSKNEISYLRNVCKIITEDCGYAMVWIGYALKDRYKSVVPMAYHGCSNSYIEKMNISWDNTEYGNGPTGRAIKSGKPELCRNMVTDPTYAPWRSEGLKSGFASSLVLPIIIDGKPFGALSIYSRETDAFSPNEINLLNDVSQDLAYGISYIRLSESERAAARAIKENEIKLKELIATKDKFFNIVAHDLKNPFTSLLGSSELLYDNINKMNNDSIRKLAFILNDAAKGGYAILQNLLDWSRSQTGLIQYNPEYVSLKNTVDENMYNLQLQVLKKEINLRSEITEDTHIWADKNMLNTILRNLLSNAVKYTHKNGTVIVKAHPGETETVISVADTGIGMPDEKVRSLFRIDNSLSVPGTEMEQGTGLGLKLCKEFTERMGGNIWVESQVGRGTQFNFNIPARNRNGAHV
jgi:PAS domain S-box-containing protein